MELEQAGKRKRSREEGVGAHPTCMAELLVRETDRQTDSPAAAKTTDTQHVDAALAAMLEQSGISSLAPSLAAHGFTTAEDVLELAQQEQYLAELLPQLGLTLRDKMKLDKMLKTLTGGASSAAGAGAAVSEPQPPTPKPTMSKKETAGAAQSPYLQAIMEALQGMGVNDASAAEALVKFGVRTVEDISDLEEADVKELKRGFGLTPFHAKKLLRYLQQGGASSAAGVGAALSKKEALALAVQKGYIQSRAKLEKKVDEDGRTALHEAADQGEEEGVSLLIAAGAAVDAKSKLGWTPLMKACENGHEGTARLLVEHRADVNAKDNSGWTPLFYACVSGHEGTARLLVEHRADVNAKDNSGTALFWAIRNNEAVAGWLRSIGAKE